MQQDGVCAPQRLRTWGKNVNNHFGTRIGHVRVFKASVTAEWHLCARAARPRRSPASALGPAPPCRARQGLSRQPPAACAGIPSGAHELCNQHGVCNRITKKQAFKVTSVGLISCVISLPSVEIGFVAAA